MTRLLNVVTLIRSDGCPLSGPTSSEAMAASRSNQPSARLECGIPAIASPLRLQDLHVHKGLVHQLIRDLAERERPADIHLARIDQAAVHEIENAIARKYGLLHRRADRPEQLAPVVGDRRGEFVVDALKHRRVQVHVVRLGVIDATL